MKLKWNKRSPEVFVDLNLFVTWRRPSSSSSSAALCAHLDIQQPEESLGKWRGKQKNSGLLHPEGLNKNVSLHRRREANLVFQNVPVFNAFMFSGFLSLLSLKVCLQMDFFYVGSESEFHFHSAGSFSCWFSSLVSWVTYFQCWLEFLVFHFSCLPIFKGSVSSCVLTPLMCPIICTLPGGSPHDPFVVCQIVGDVHGSANVIWVFLKVFWVPSFLPFWSVF